MCKFDQFLTLQCSPEIQAIGTREGGPQQKRQTAHVESPGLSRTESEPIR